MRIVEHCQFLHALYPVPIPSPENIHLCGENDIAYGHSADSVLVNFRTLYRVIRKKLPNAQIYYLSIKPSPSRVKYQADDLKANEQVKKYIKSRRKLQIY